MDTAFEFLLYLLCGIGAFLSWLAKGCNLKAGKQRLSSHFTRPQNTAHQFKSNRWLPCLVRRGWFDLALDRSGTSASLILSFPPRI